MKHTLDRKLMSKGKRVALTILGVVGSIVIVATLAVAGYVGYLFLTYDRIGDVELEVTQNSNIAQIQIGTEYSAVSYNIGFGAYSQDYTFFLDTGYGNDGNPTCGYWSKARSKEAVEFNTNGAISAVASLNPDFVTFQEVDTNSTRSYQINQDGLIENAFPAYSKTHAVNFHSAFLPYPLYDMHGSVNAGLTTLSRFQIQDAHRHSYTVSDGVSKFFDLDRCFSSQRIHVSNGKDLYIVNFHMSAYDEGGTIRTQQVAEMNAFLNECGNRGDYVIVGGDFNHDLLTFDPDYQYNATDHRAFNMTKKFPDWVHFYFSEDGNSPLPTGYTLVASDNVPACRNNDIEYSPSESFVCVIEGVVRDNDLQNRRRGFHKLPEGL